MIKKEEKDNKIYITVKDEETGIEWTAVVEKVEFEWCVKQKEELEVEDAEKSVMLDYALFGNCAIPNVTAEEVQKFIDEIYGREDE